MVIPQAESRGSLLFDGTEYQAQFEPTRPITPVTTVKDVSAITQNALENTDPILFVPNHDYAFREQHGTNPLPIPDNESQDDLTDCVSVRLRRRRAAENAMTGIAAALGLESSSSFTWNAGLDPNSGKPVEGNSKGDVLTQTEELEDAAGGESGSDIDDGDSEWMPTVAEELDGSVANLATSNSGRSRRQKSYDPSHQLHLTGYDNIKPRPLHRSRSSSSSPYRSKPKPKAHSCPLCPETFSRRADCERHLEFYHKSRDIVREQKFVCTRCSYAFCREDARRRHLMNGCSGRVRKQRARSNRVD